MKEKSNYDSKLFSFIEKNKSKAVVGKNEEELVEFGLLPQTKNELPLEPANFQYIVVDDAYPKRANMRFVEEQY